MITYDDKVSTVSNPLPDINKVTDADMNQIKSVVNANETALGTKVPTSRTLTIDGVAFDLSADRTWTTGATSFLYFADAYGLVGDSDGTTGNGTDNATALSDLVDLVIANGGGTIRLGKGIYRYTGAFSKTGNNVTVEGDGMGVSTLFCDNTSVNLYAWRIAGNNNHYRNFTIQGRKTFQGNGVGLYVYGTNSSADHVEIKEANCFGIYVAHGSNITISNCVVHDCAADGIHVSDNINRVAIVDNLIYTCADDGIGIGFEGTTSNVVVTGNNIFETSAGIAIMGYSLTGVSPDVFNITVSNNNIQTTWLSGIAIHVQQGSMENINIHGNTIRNTGGFAPITTTKMRGVGNSFGIGLMANAPSTSYTMRNISITDNILFTVRSRFISVGFDGAAGTIFAQMRDIKISGNQMQGLSAIGGVGAWGFSAGGSQSTPADGLYPGIYIENTIGNVEVSNNQIRGASMNAILVASSVTGQISLINNQAFDCNAGTGTAYVYSILSTTSSTSAVVKGNTYLGTAFGTGIANITSGTTILEYDSPQEPTSLVTGTDTLDYNDLNKTILCSGTSSDYTVTLPTAVGITGKWFNFVGVTALTKVVSVNANSTETINGLTTDRPFTGRGGFKIVSDGANWQVVDEKPSWITYTATWTGTSGQPTHTNKYSLMGKQMTILYTTTSTAASGTGMTFTIPSGYTAVGGTASFYARIMSNSSYVNTGMARVGTTTVDLFLTAAGGAISASGNKEAEGMVVFEIL